VIIITTLTQTIFTKASMSN